MRRTRFSLCAVQVAICCWTLFACPLSAESPSTWRSLNGEDTFFAARIPNGSGAASALLNNTKLGQVMFSDKRMESLREMIAEETEEGEDSLLNALLKYGFTIDDLPKLLAGETGVAYLRSEAAGDKTAMLGVFWLQPDGEINARILSAIGEAIEEQEDDEYPIERSDIQLAGHDVMQFLVPEIDIEMGDIDFPDRDEFGDADDWREARQRAIEKAVEESTEIVKHSTMFVVDVNGTLLVAGTEASDEEQRRAQTADVEGLLARLIAAHENEDGEFVSRVQSVAGVRSAFELPGELVVEALFDVPAFARMMEQRVAGPNRAQFEMGARLFGLQQLGPLALGVSLDEVTMHSAMSMNMEAPRSGLLKLIDQEPMSFDPPEWAPSSAIGYGQIRIDPRQVWDTVRSELSTAFPEQLQAIEARFNQQLQQLASTNIDELFGAFGSRHMAVTFAPETQEIDLGDGETMETPQERGAYVVEVLDNDVVGRLMGAARQFAALAPAAKPTEEQGYSGIRFSTDTVEGAVVHGNDYLVIAVGNEILPLVLKSLNDPPQGEDALVNAPMLERARELMEFKPAVRHEVLDANRYVSITINALREMMLSEDSAFEFDDEEEPPIADRLLSLFMPKEEEAKNMFGVTASEFSVNDDGFVFRSVTELPKQ